MYNKKEWVSKEVITKEALNNIENGIAELDAKMNDVATKKELQVIEDNIAENTNELDDLKEGLVASLVAQGHTVDVNSSWKDLFDILLTGSGSVPDVPNPDVPADDPIEIITDEITIQVGETYDATKLYNLQEGYAVQYKYSSIIAIEGEHTIVGKEVGTTELEITCGEIIKTVTINVVEPTGGMVLFDGGYNTTDSDFGKLLLPEQYVYEASGCITADLKNEVCIWGAFCSPNQVNFNNYDAVAITIYTENKQQTNTQLLVGRGIQTTFLIGTSTDDVSTVTYEESTFKVLENTTTPQTYVFNFADLREKDNDMGYLGFRVRKGDGDGKVYISKIVVYPEGTYYTESINE